MHRPARRALVAIPALALALGSPALAACSSSGAESSPTVAESPTGGTTSPSTSATPTSDVKEIDVTLTGSKVSPAPDKIKVDKGTEVKLTVTRDSDGEIHVHGYDLEEQAKAGVPVTFTFTADQEGVFEVEAHDPDVLLFQLQVS